MGAGPSSITSAAGGGGAGSDGSFFALVAALITVGFHLGNCFCKKRRMKTRMQNAANLDCGGGSKGGGNATVHNRRRGEELI